MKVLRLSTSDWFYDSPPSKPAIIYNEYFMATRHEEGCHQGKICTHFLACNVLSNEDVGVARGAVFQEIRRVAGFKTSDFAEKNLRGLDR